MITIERNGKQIRDYTFISKGLQYDYVIHEIKMIGKGMLLDNLINNKVAEFDVFNNREQFERKLKIFGRVHIARIIDIKENKYDIWIKR